MTQFSHWKVQQNKYIPPTTNASPVTKKSRRVKSFSGNCTSLFII